MANLNKNIPLDVLLGSDFSDCPCGRRHRVPTKEALIRKGAISNLPALMERHFPTGVVTVTFDSNTYSAAGSKVENILNQNRRRFSCHFADEKTGHLHADDASIVKLVKSIREEGSVGVIAVGAGTISDIGKAAATECKIPLITIATAASMNGYTSAIVAIMSKGVKITAPANPPEAIIADINVLAAAPRRMNAAGFGDLMSKNASGADWLMSHILNGEHYCDLPGQVVDEAIAACIANASEIKSNSPKGLKILIDALLRSGVSMVLAGSSAPASGGEHLISHLWDMTPHWSGRAPALHGEQTGVTTLISLALYERLLSLSAEDIRNIPVKQAFSNVTELETGIGAKFRDLAPSVLTYARKKYMDGDALAKRRETIIEKWDEIREKVSKIVIPPEQLRRHLLEAGALTRIKDIDIPEDELHFAYMQSRWIRGRYTVLDLAAEIGVLEEWKDDVLVKSGVLGK